MTRALGKHRGIPRPTPCTVEFCPDHALRGADPWKVGQALKRERVPNTLTRDLERLFVEPRVAPYLHAWAASVWWSHNGEHAGTYVRRCLRLPLRIRLACVAMYNAGVEPVALMQYIHEALQALKPAEYVAAVRASPQCAQR